MQIESRLHANAHHHPPQLVKKHFPWRDGSHPLQSTFHRAFDIKRASLEELRATQGSISNLKRDENGSVVKKDKIVSIDDEEKKSSKPKPKTKTVVAVKPKTKTKVLRRSKVCLSYFIWAIDFENLLIFA